VFCDQSGRTSAPISPHAVQTIRQALLESHLAELLAQTGIARPRQRAREIWLLSEGAVSLILVHGDRGYAAAAARAAKRLVRNNAPRAKTAGRAHRAG
jgi:hypothetical protein